MVESTPASTATAATGPRSGAGQSTSRLSWQRFLSSKREGKARVCGCFSVRAQLCESEVLAVQHYRGVLEGRSLAATPRRTAVLDRAQCGEVGLVRKDGAGRAESADPEHTGPAGNSRILLSDLNER